MYVCVYIYTYVHKHAHRERLRQDPIGLTDCFPWPMVEIGQEDSDSGMANTHMNDSKFRYLRSTPCLLLS